MLRILSSSDILRSKSTIARSNNSSPVTTGDNKGWCNAITNEDIFTHKVCLYVFIVHSKLVIIIIGLDLTGVN